MTISQKKSTPRSICPCGSGLGYEACCGQWHQRANAPQAPDALALMRSRYSAYVLDQIEYLQQTWHPSTRPAHIAPNPPNLKWLGLQIRGYEQQDADHATVEFVARYRQAGRAVRLHETSRFVRHDGQWLYVDGDMHDTLKDGTARPDTY